jgi:DNA-binding transcriptional LysR family regulator
VTLRRSEDGLLAFAQLAGQPATFWKPVNVWSFVNGKKKETLTFHPHLSMNDYAGLAAALLAGAGIGDLPPLVQPALLREGRLVEVMPDWRFTLFHLWLVHTSSRYVTRPVRVFKEFASQTAPHSFLSFRLEGISATAGAKVASTRCGDLSSME